MSLGWNFDMNLFPDGQLSIDSNASPMTKKAVEEIKTKFPKGDCFTLDVSIKNAQGLISSIYMEKARETYDYNRKDYINQMSKFLPDWIGQLEADFKKQDCRNQFEKIRIQDMASTLTKGASKQEVSILNPNFKEQYLYIGIGAVVLLLGLYVVTKK